MIYILSYILLFSAAVQDTVPPPVEPDSLQSGFADPDSAQMETIEPEVINEVKIWRYQVPPGFEEQEDDSTLRWKNILNLTQRFARRPGGITYRMGTLGRKNGIDYHTFENRHFNVEMDGLNITDPLTGEVNWNRIPTHKIRSMWESDYGPVYNARIRLRDYYLIKPRTYLNFDESDYNYRHLEFSATHNINQQTNIELSYWDRRDGIGYNRSQTEGNQIVFKGYHQMNDKWLLKGGYISNSMEQQQSFGYLLENPDLFAFNPFTEIPNQSGASSEEQSNDIYLQAHFRADTNKAIQTSMGLHYQTEKRSAQFNVDTTGTDFRNIELFLRHRLEGYRTGLTATVRPYLLENRVKDQLTMNRFLGVKSDLQGKLEISRGLTFFGNTRWIYRDDSMNSFESGAKLAWNIRSVFTVSAFGGYANRSPDLQALYWQSDTFAGNPDLRNEETFTAGVETEIPLGRFFTLGGRADMREVENGAFVNLESRTEGQFVNIDPYTQLAATGWLDLESPFFEGEVSASYKHFESAGSANPINQRLHTSNERLWLKGSLYWKNYLFDRATFVKAGVIGLHSPNYMRTAEYIVPLNRWQHGSGEYFNPPYSRVDIDVSARIRWFMLLLRWENIFDRVNQAGYFETVGYPMPERRFILGIRVLFTN